jgi:hypothetical protein
VLTIHEILWVQNITNVIAHFRFLPPGSLHALRSTLEESLLRSGSLGRSVWGDSVLVKNQCEKHIRACQGNSKV